MDENKGTEDKAIMPIPLTQNIAQMTSEALAASIHSQLGPRIQQEITVDEVKSVLAQLKWDHTRPSQPVPRLMVNRLRFKGEKKLAGLELTPIDYDQAFAPGVNVILMADRNLVGKSSILKTIKFALTGDNEDFDNDVKGWIKDIWLQFSLGERQLTIALAYREDNWHGAIATGLESRPIEEVIKSLPRKDQHYIGLPAIQDGLSTLFFREYCLSSLGWTQMRAGGAIVKCSTSWQTYFQALRIRDDDHRYLICEPVAGIANQERLLFMSFLGLHLAEPLNQLGIEKTIITKSQLVTEKDVESLNSQKETLQADRNRVQKRLREIDEFQRSRQKVVLNGDLPVQIAAAEGEQLQIATEINELVAQQKNLISKAQRARAQAKRMRTYIELQREFSGIDVTLCPRCSKWIDGANIERESETHECRLCNKVAEAASGNDAEQIDLEAKEWDEEALKNQEAHLQVGHRVAVLRTKEATLKKHADELRSTIASGISAAYPTPDEDTEKAKLNESLGKMGHELWLINQNLGSAVNGVEDAEKRAKVVRVVREVLTKEAETRNATINLRLKEMTQAITAAIGAKNITGVSCSPLGTVTLLKNDEKVTFTGFKNPGERFRIKLALFLSMMQLGREAGIGRHPGFLLIDQLGAAEMAQDNMNASAATLKSIDANFSDQLQIICTTARSEFATATISSKIIGAKVGSGSEEYAF